VLLLDIDLFKQHNDAYGHAGGRCSVEDGGALVPIPNARQRSVARQGGDEFAILLPNTAAKAR
jgi:diguanylate cyclase (GGDEF)-like protein